MPARAAPARVLVVWCPDWPLVAVGTDPTVPAVVVAAGRVSACTAAARVAGVRRGHRLRDAERYCPEVAVHAHDPEREARAFEPVVAVIEEICPRIEVVRPGLVAVPARGPSRYYGGEAAVAAAVRDVVLDHGVACAVGVGDGAFAADLAARAAWADGASGSSPGDGVRVVESPATAGFLRPHPVAMLEMPELAGVLGRLGIRTLGDLAALPARDVLARFGSDGAAAHRLASGLDARPPAARPAGEDLSAEIEFDPPAEQSEPAVFAAKSLADRLHAGLSERGLACVRVEVEAFTDDGRSRSRLWRHGGALSSLAVAERVRWQLDAWRTAGELTGGLTHLRLAPDHLVVDTGRQLTLWGQSRAGDDVDRAATRIQVMLGHAAVTRPVVVGGRGPGEQVARVPWGDTPDTAPAADNPWPGRVPAPPPAVVPPVPWPARVLDASGAPVAVSGRSEVSAPPARLVLGAGEALAVSGWTGPWPALEHWWDPASRRRCARFQLLTEDGRGWLVVVQDGAWAVEGVYT
jgi:protein ImuB